MKTALFYFFSIIIGTIIFYSLMHLAASSTDINYRYLSAAIISSVSNAFVMYFLVFKKVTDKKAPDKN